VVKKIILSFLGPKESEEPAQFPSEEEEKRGFGELGRSG